MSDQELQNLVRSLPEDTPSLAWRSGLNERLREESRRRSRRFALPRLSGLRAGLVGFGALGAVAASLVAIVALTSSPLSPRDLSSLSSPNPAPIVSPSASPTGTMPSAEAPSAGASSAGVADLLAVHDEGAAIADVSGAGVDARESDLTERELRLALVQGML